MNTSWNGSQRRTSGVHTSTPLLDFPLSADSFLMLFQNPGSNFESPMK